jgi:hypothetical protein
LHPGSYTQLGHYPFITRSILRAFKDQRKRSIISETGTRRLREKQQLIYLSARRTTHLLDERDRDGEAAALVVLILPPFLHGALLVASVRLAVLATSWHFLSLLGNSDWQRSSQQQRGASDQWRQM